MTDPDSRAPFWEEKTTDIFEFYELFFRMHPKILHGGGGNSKISQINIFCSHVQKFNRIWFFFIGERGGESFCIFVFF